MLKLLNTLSGQKEEFLPIKSKNVGMFVCGPTVYDYIHIGNARTFVFFDVFAKYLKHEGYKVEYIQNITDIDDKIIKRARTEGEKYEKIVNIYEKAFMEDIKNLGINSVTRFAKATGHIQEIINQIKTLLEKEYAYETNDGIYFDISKFKNYGNLARRTIEQAEDATSRIDESTNKKNKGDFVLWKFSSPTVEEYEPSFRSPWGLGRPGWHIEDTAISEKYLGQQYDIHGGGQDLIFPHHEAEIAQQEAASGKEPFVRYWMHVGFVVSKERKISKSLGNFEILRNLLGKYSKEVVRHYLLTNAHYRTPLNFTLNGLDASKAAVRNLKELIAKIKNVKPSANGLADFEEKLKEYKQGFFNALDEDFNIPEAFGLISGWYSYINSNLQEISASQKEAVELFLQEINDLFGVIPQYELDQDISEKQKIINKLRSEGKYEEADKIKIELRNKGFYVSDSDVAGTIIIKKK